MPPKKIEQPNKKTVEKKKEKIVEDKTFGLKNKKGSKQQKFIQTVQHQVIHMGRSAKQLAASEKERLERESKKEEKKKLQDELNNLFKPVQQTIGKGTDPKSVLCAFFKAGQCTKGDKCKFSHDLTIERKAEKRSLYEDKKEEEDTMVGWDEAKLEEVVNQKHGESNKTKQKTEIICKFFLEAVETNKYGWFWSCPKGDHCIYKHILPPGFVMKKDTKKETEGEKISLEDLIEKERAALSSQDFTRVTLQTFLKWKERKRQEKITESKAVSEKKKSNFAVGKLFGISGKELFEFNPDMVVMDDDEADDDEYEREDDDDDQNEECEVTVREIDLSMFSSEQLLKQPQSNHANITTAPAKPHNHINNHNPPTKKDKKPSKDGDKGGEEVGGLVGAVGGEGLDGGDGEIDENLFDGEDLDMVEDELENLELED